MSNARSIGDILAGAMVPDPGTEQITYIEESKLRADDANFYAIDGVEDLAANIELIGLQQPIRVRRDPENEGGYIVVSGHRRLTAIRTFCKKDQPGKWDRIPCIVEPDTGESDAMRELRLIYANSDTRRMSSSDISKQAERVEALLYQLQSEGVEFPGRMRDHVAEACKVSKSKLSRLKVIRDGLEPGIKAKYWDSGNRDKCLNEAAAYELARMPHDLQQQITRLWLEDKYHAHTGLRYLHGDMLDKMRRRVDAVQKSKCGLGGHCDNAERKRLHIITSLIKSQWAATYCEDHCCGKCPILASCPSVCSHQLAAQKNIKQKNREEKAAEKQRQEALAAPKVKRIADLWSRFATAREAAGITPKDYREAIHCGYAFSDADCTKAEAGMVTANTYLPFGYNFSLDEAERLVRGADALGVSLDYLFCRSANSRTFDQAAAAATPEAASWQPGDRHPDHSCECVVDFSVEGAEKPLRNIYRWDSMADCWRFKHGPRVEATPVRWLELPEVMSDEQTAKLPEDPQ